MQTKSERVWYRKSTNNLISSFSHAHARTRTHAALCGGGLRSRVGVKFNQMELAIGQFAPFAPVGYPTRFLFNEEEEAEEESKR